MRTSWLVTGGARYIGAHAVRALAAGGERVVGCDDLSTGSADRVPDGAALVVGSVLDRAALEGAIRDHAVTGVVHIAARAAPRATCTSRARPPRARPDQAPARGLPRLSSGSGAGCCRGPGTGSSAATRSAILARCRTAAAHRSRTAAAKRSWDAGSAGPSSRRANAARSPASSSRSGWRTAVSRAGTPDASGASTVAAATVGKDLRNTSSASVLVLATAYGLPLARKSLITLDTSLISRSARLKQAYSAGRASVTTWCSHSGSDAQYASSHASWARRTAAARPGSGSGCRSIRSAWSAAGRKPAAVSRSSSAARRARPAAADASGRGPPRARFAVRTSSRMRRSAARARGSTDPVSGCGLYSSRTPGSASSARTRFSPASTTEVLPGLPSQPSQVGAYRTVVNAPGAGGPAYGRTASSCGRPISTTSLSSTPTSASAYRSRAAGPATHTSS
ncbi:NAD-dependent epimerase/dehydratase family protein [Streptomyces hyderabadensis]|uniref:NAD-dependent epimerase/dehydratase family protein n=1 Tax=Streptomyces hyderabadensis TaxID=598549 RepID=UPI0027DFD294|nr:NAD-dependent epimerase/dehydratase family protein [Streptomyces hyderabadensis]